MAQRQRRCRARLGRRGHCPSPPQRERLGRRGGAERRLAGLRRRHARPPRQLRRPQGQSSLRRSRRADLPRGQGQTDDRHSEPTVSRMFRISAFADEIDPNPQTQIDVLKSCGVRHIELRSILKTNVLDLTDLQVAELKSLLQKHGFRLSAIGSPIGKIKIDGPFEPHLKRFQRAIELSKVFGTPNIRIFSYYLPDGGEWSDHRDEVMRRMGEELRLAAKAGVRLIHENEHNIYGDDPVRVKDLMETMKALPEGAHLG